MNNQSDIDRSKQLDKDLDRFIFGEFDPNIIKEAVKNYSDILGEKYAKALASYTDERIRKIYNELRSGKQKFYNKYKTPEELNQNAEKYGGPKFDLI